MGIQENIKTALLSGGTAEYSKGNAPAEYAGRQTRYLDSATRRLAQERAKYASDYFAGQAQGLNPGKPTEWTDIRLRMADIIRPSAAIQRDFDDFKIILIAEPDIDYLQPGTKIRAAGSTWLAVNAANLSNPIGNGIIRRCNAAWRYLDWYGNVREEPIIVENDRANANDSDHQESGLATKGYFNVTAQMNSATAQLDTNSRLILGSGAYRVTGFSDFQTEFTGDDGTVRTLSFTIRYEEPNAAIDDMERRIAGGKDFTWEIGLQAPVLSTGESGQLITASRRCGEPVESTEAYPISYLYESSDPGIATVDAQGLITAVSEGTAIITATLAQNPAESATAAITVAGDTPRLAFTTAIPETLRAYQSAEVEAAYFRGGRTEEPVAWTLSGRQGAYTYTADGNRITVSCWAGSTEPLTVTASCAGLEISAEIELEGI